MDEKTLPVVPSSWEEGLGVVEKNNDITYYKSYVYEMVEPFLSLPPLTPPSRRRGLQNDSLLYYDTPPYRRGKAKSSYATRRVPTFSGDKFYIVSNNLEDKYEIRQTEMEESRHMAR